MLWKAGDHIRYGAESQADADGDCTQCAFAAQYQQIEPRIGSDALAMPENPVSVG